MPIPPLLSRDYLSGVDTAWLRMEDPTNLMMITGVFVFDGQLSVERLTETVERRLLEWRRFQQRVIQPRVGPAYWEDDPHFNLEYHLRRVALPEPSDKDALQDFVSVMMSTPLDFNRPLWQAHIIENVGSQSALLVRLHHCIADGIALMYVLLSLTDFVADAPHPKGKKRKKKRALNPLQMFFKQAEEAVKFASNARETTEKYMRDGMEKLMHPSTAYDLVKQGSETAGQSAKALARLVLRSADPITPFKGALGVQKKAVWSGPVSLADVKAIGKVTGGTVNDVLLTAMCGALRRYLETRDVDTAGLSFRATVPVNLRPPNDMGKLGNKFGLVFLDLPVGTVDPVERLRILKKNMDELKQSPEAVVALGVLEAMGRTPGEVQDMGVGLFAAKATAVMTNVPGPRVPLFMAGSPIDTIMFWVPQSGRLGLGVSILSYAGTVRLGVAVDAALVPDPGLMITGFHDEFEELKQLVAWVAAEQADG